MISAIHKRLKRITSSTNFLAEVDSLRFIAIMPVFLGHLGTFLITDSRLNYDTETLIETDFLYYLRIFSPIGVPLFYCISGFILSLPFARTDRTAPTYSKYLKRRLSRLEPPYLLCMLGFFLAHTVIFGAPVVDYLLRFLASLTYTHNLIYGTWSSINPVAWTLEIEVQFYLLAPFIVRGLAKLSRIYRTITLLALIGSFVSIEHFGSETLATYNLDRSILTKFHYFAIGILICFEHKQNPLSNYKKTYSWDTIVLLCIPLSQLDKFIYINKIIDHYAFSISIFLLFIGAFRGKVSNRLANFPVFYILGGMCYSIYLLHYPIFHAIGKYTTNLYQTGTYWSDYLFQLATTGLLTMMICVIFYILIERPCMDPSWPSKMLKRLRPTSQ